MGEVVGAKVSSAGPVLIGAALGENVGEKLEMDGALLHSGTPALVNRHCIVPAVHAGMLMHGNGPVKLFGVISTPGKFPKSRDRNPSTARALTLSSVRRS